MSNNIKQDQYVWIELAALLPNGKMVRNQFVHIDDVEAIAKWRKRFKNTDVFSSICLYAEPNKESKFTAPIFFDIDSADNLPQTRVSAITLCEMLMDRAFTPQDCLDIYFSGNKGFHVIVPCEVFKPSYSPHMLKLYKRMAEKAEMTGVQFIDKGVYTNRRIWRLPNSINSKSGLFKIPLTYEELRDISIDGILEIAESLRPEDSFAVPRECQKAVVWYRTAIECLEKKSIQSSSVKKINSQFKNGWRMPPCIKAIEAAVIPDGIRHELYLALARYYAYLNMHHEEMQDRIEAIDQRNPIRDPDSIQRAVKFGCEHPGFPGCEAFKKYCRMENCFYAKLKETKTQKSEDKEMKVF